MNNTDSSWPTPLKHTHVVRIDLLKAADSPRLAGVDKTHVQRLAKIFASLPPVLVHRPTLRVIDGMHRIGAATLLGHDTIRVQYFDGAEDQVFLRSVVANVAHGLPLPVADRKSAAERILRAHPHLSDRAIAACTGLDAKTVAAVRLCSTADAPPLNIRTGTDGKAHPLDRTAERMYAAELMTHNPQLPLRAVVQKTGLSLGTVHDVRRRLQRGAPPVPESRQGTRTATAPAPAAAPGLQTAAPPASVSRAAAGARSRVPLDILRTLAADPSLRHSEAGREFLRWIHTHVVIDEAWRKRADAVPAHCSESVAELARECAQAWRRFADEMTRRRHAPVPAPARSRATSPSRP